MSTTDGPRGAQTAGAAAAKIAVATTEIEVTTTHIAGEWRQAAALLVLREVAHARLRCDVLCIESASRLTRGCASAMAHGIGGRGYTESGPAMHFAAKRLTRSDLTFFEYQFRRQNAGNQKSINLNRNVFVDLLFPLAASMAGGIARQFPVPVSIYGPGLRATRHMITRKVIAAGGSQKNWRLNGEFVPDPDDDPARYHGLAEKDLAVFGFEGSADRRLRGAACAERRR